MNKKIIAAVRGNRELEEAVRSNALMIFMLNPNIEDIKAQAEMAHNNGKNSLFILTSLKE